MYFVIRERYKQGVEKILLPRRTTVLQAEINARTPVATFYSVDHRLSAKPTVLILCQLSSQWMDVRLYHN